jgi:diguanylate cyclase (GGDEF)-like protein
VTRPRARQLAPLAAAWLASAAAIGAAASGWWTPGTLAVSLAAALTIGVGTALAVAARRMTEPLSSVPRAGDRPARLLLGPSLALAVTTGALGSPALAVVALCVLWCLRRRPLWSVAIAAAATMVVVALLGVIAGTVPTLADVATGATLVAAIVIAPKWIGLILGERLLQERRRSERLGGLFGERALTPAQLLTVQRSGVVARPLSGPAGRFGGAAAESSPGPRASADALPRYLRDVRDWAGADEVVFWRWDTAQRALVATCWSTAEADAPRFVSEEWLPVVSWATQERLVHVDREGTSPRLGVCPVEWGVTSLGSISVARGGDGMRVSRDELREWLPRFATHVASLSDLFEERDAAARQTRHAQALLSASREFPASRTVPDLAKSLFRAAMDITSAKRAALVRWFPDEGRGSLVCATDDHPVPQGIPVTEASYAGAVCAGGRPYVWEDARLLDPSARIYGDREPARGLGALGIVPLHRAGQVLGALVLEGDMPREVRADDRRTLRNLADLAAASLSGLLELEISKVKATTDELTGLANRRAFEEQLAQRLSEVDRVGGSVALIVADVDHFKRINDTHGHQVGDAVLQAIAATLRDSVRDFDVPARYGGEEFVILLPHTDSAGAMETAERLRRAVESRPVRIGGSAVPVTLSFGVASYPGSASSRESVFTAADRALYKAKADGRNCVRSASPRDIQPRL